MACVWALGGKDPSKLLTIKNGSEGGGIRDVVTHGGGDSGAPGVVEGLFVDERNCGSFNVFFSVEPIFHSFHSFHIGLKRRVLGAYGGVVRLDVDSLTINLDL